MRYMLALAAVLSASAAQADWNDSYYCNGQSVYDFSGDVLYPNGRIVTDNFRDTYYPNGQIVEDNFRNVYYPNGQIVQDNFRNIYWPNGRISKDSWGNTYYANGQVAADRFGCYHSTGVPMNPCVPYAYTYAVIPGFGVMSAQLSLSSGLIGGIWGAHMSMRYPNYSIEFDVNLLNGFVQNVQAFCYAR